MGALAAPGLPRLLRQAVRGFPHEPAVRGRARVVALVLALVRTRGAAVLGRGRRFVVAVPLAMRAQDIFGWSFGTGSRSFERGCGVVDRPRVTSCHARDLRRKKK